MLEDPYDFKPQPLSRFWGRTLLGSLLVIGLLVLGAAKCAQAAPTFKAHGADGQPAELVLRDTPCQDEKVVEHLKRRVKAEFVPKFRAAVLTWGGKRWASCWIEVDGTVFSIDEEGSLFQPIPRQHFKDNSI